MPLTPEAVYRLLPRDVPRERAPWDDAAAREIFERPDLTPPARELLVRSFLWAQVLTRRGLFQFSGLPISTAFGLSSGFVEVTEDELGESLTRNNHPIVAGHTFGIHLNVREAPEVPRVLSIEIEDARFPLIIEESPGLVYHRAPPGPNLQGTWQSTCWVQDPNGTNGWTYGILTCRHGFGTPTKNQNVPLASTQRYALPTSAVLADFDQFSIDAAVLEIQGNDWPAGVSRLRPTAAIAPGTQAVFESNGKQIIANVLRTFLLPSYYGNLVGQRIFVDQTGIPGDSGTLLADASTNNGLGIYIGEIPSGRRKKEGLFQSLKQAADYFKLDLYL